MDTYSLSFVLFIILYSSGRVVGSNSEIEFRGVLSGDAESANQNDDEDMYQSLLLPSMAATVYALDPPEKTAQLNTETQYLRDSHTFQQPSQNNAGHITLYESGAISDLDFVKPDSISSEPLPTREKRNVGMDGNMGNQMGNGMVGNMGGAVGGPNQINNGGQQYSGPTPGSGQQQGQNMNGNGNGNGNVVLGSTSLPGSVMVYADKNGYPYTVSSYTNIINGVSTYGAVTLRTQTTLYGGNTLAYGKNVFNVPNQGDHMLPGLSSVVVLNGVTQTVSTYTRIINGLATYGTVTISNMQTVFVANLNDASGPAHPMSGGQFGPNNGQNFGANSNINGQNFGINSGTGGQSFGSSSNGQSTGLSSNLGSSSGLNGQVQGSSFSSNSQSFGSGSNNQNFVSNAQNSGMVSNGQSFDSNSNSNGQDMAFNNLNGQNAAYSSNSNGVSVSSNQNGQNIAYNSNPITNINGQNSGGNYNTNGQNSGMNYNSNGQSSGIGFNLNQNSASVNSGGQNFGSSSGFSSQSSGSVSGQNFGSNSISNGNQGSIMGMVDVTDASSANGQNVQVGGGPYVKFTGGITSYNNNVDRSQGGNPSLQSGVTNVQSDAGNAVVVCAECVQRGTDNALQVKLGGSQGQPYYPSSQPNINSENGQIVYGQGNAQSPPLLTTTLYERFPTVYNGISVMGKRTRISVYYAQTAVAQPGFPNVAAQPVYFNPNPNSTPQPNYVNANVNQGPQPVYPQQPGAPVIQPTPTTPNPNFGFNNFASILPQGYTISPYTNLGDDKFLTYGALSFEYAQSAGYQNGPTGVDDFRIIQPGNAIVGSGALTSVTKTEYFSTFYQNSQIQGTRTVVSFAYLGNNNQQTGPSGMPIDQPFADPNRQAPTPPQMGVLNQTSTPEPQQPDTFQQQQGQQIINQQPTPPPISGFQGDNNYQQPGPASSSSSDHQQQQQQQIRVASNTAPLSPIQPSMAGSGNSNSGSDSNYQSVSLYSIIGNDNLLTTGKVTFVAPSLGGMFFTATDVRTVTPIVVSPGILTSISRAEAFFIPISNTRVPGERTRISYYYAQGSPGNQQAGSGGSSGLATLSLTQSGNHGQAPAQDMPSAMAQVNPSRVRRSLREMDADNEAVRASFSVSSYTRGNIRGAVTFFIPLADHRNEGQLTFSMRDFQTQLPDDLPVFNANPVAVTRTELFQTVFNGAFITGTRTRILVTYAPGNAVVPSGHAIPLSPNPTYNPRIDSSGNKLRGILIEEPVPSFFGESRGSLEFFDTIINGAMVKGTRTRYDDVPSQGRAYHQNVPAFGRILADRRNNQRISLHNKNPGIGPRVELFPTIINGVAVTGTRTRYNGVLNEIDLGSTSGFEVLRGMPFPFDTNEKVIQKRSPDTLASNDPNSGNRSGTPDPSPYDLELSYEPEPPERSTGQVLNWSWEALVDRSKAETVVEIRMCSGNATGFCPDEKQICEMLDGDFQCNCIMGYGLTASGSCEDIDECAAGSTIDSPCSSNARCINMLGSFACVCKSGFVDQWSANKKSQPSGPGRVCASKRVVNVEPPDTHTSSLLGSGGIANESSINETKGDCWVCNLHRLALGAGISLGVILIFTAAICFCCLCQKRRKRVIAVESQFFSNVYSQADMRLDREKTKAPGQKLKKRLSHENRWDYPLRYVDQEDASEKPSVASTPSFRSTSTTASTESAPDEDRVSCASGDFLIRKGYFRTRPHSHPTAPANPTETYRQNI